ncbi:MAG: cupin domain-containing protein [Deltaproteobacteria bacterium]|nr:MAG: cupin domain-containing protein [Deltaproteobacteria bacterium]
MQDFRPESGRQRPETELHPRRPHRGDSGQFLTLSGRGHTTTPLPVDKFRTRKADSARRICSTGENSEIRLPISAFPKNNCKPSKTTKYSSLFSEKASIILWRQGGKKVKKVSPDSEPPEEREGGSVRRWVYTEGKLEVVIYEYDGGTRFPEHSHPEEQVTVVLEGGLTFHSGGREVHLEKGEILFIPPSLPHSATSREGCRTRTINIFTPPRKERP